MAEPADFIVPMLREMRAENVSLHEQTRVMIAAPDRRLGAVEKRQDSFRSALSAEGLLGRLVTGEFEERLTELESKMRKLETQS